MGYDLSEIKKFAIKSKLVKDPIVYFLAEGFGNYCFLIEENRRKYVLRIKKTNEEQFIDSLEREYVFLKYFNFKGIHFVPEVYYFDKTENFLIENFLEGKMVHQKDFTDVQIDLFAKQLHQLFNLDVDEFFEYCEKNNLRKFEIKSEIQTFKKYGLNRFKLFENSKFISKRIIEWLKDKLESNFKYLESIENSSENNLGFNWGDVQSKIIENEKGEMFFYDFEHVDLYSSGSLLDIKIHGKFSTKKFKYLVERYAYYFNKSKQFYLDEIVSQEKIIRVNDVVWAVMKWNETKEKKFEDLTYKRIQLVKNLE